MNAVAKGVASKRGRKSRLAGKAPPAGDAPESLSDQVYDQQYALNRVASVVHIAKCALETVDDWDSDPTLSALYAAIFEVEDRLNTITDNLDCIHLELAAGERTAGRRQDVANG